MPKHSGRALIAIANERLSDGTVYSSEALDKAARENDDLYFIENHLWLYYSDVTLTDLHRKISEVTLKLLKGE